MKSLYCYNFFSNFFSRYKKYMICLISVSMFLDVLPAFNCARDIGNLWSIYLGVSILIPLIFCCLLKSRIFSTILTLFFGFSFSRTFLLLIEFFKSINNSWRRTLKPETVFRNYGKFLANKWQKNVFISP